MNAAQATLNDEPLDPRIRYSSYSRRLSCPSCQKVIMTGTEMAVPGTFLADDGDTIPGLPPRTAGMACWAMAMVGKCPFCKARTWHLDIILHEGTDEALLVVIEDEPDWAERWETADADASNGIAMWTLDVSGDRRTYQFNVGPLPVPDAFRTHGPFGVTSCGSGPEFWTHCAETFHLFRPTAEEVLAAVRGREAQPQ